MGKLFKESLKRKSYLYCHLSVVSSDMYGGTLTLRHYTFHFLLLACAKQPFGNVRRSFRYLSDFNEHYYLIGVEYYPILFVLKENRCVW